MSLAETRSRDIPETISLAHPNPEHYLNRETSWLMFNWRVLEEAQATHNPLLERLHFLAISANNLDEFCMKRIGGLQRQVAAGVTRPSIDGMTPQAQIENLHRILTAMAEAESSLLNDELRPELAANGIVLASWSDLTEPQRKWMSEHFMRSILPILTPLGVGPGQPFPFISNLSLSLAVQVRSPGEEENRFARVKIPSNRPRFVQMPGEHVFLPLEALIAQHLDLLFVGMEIIESSAFRVTRNADVERNEEEAEDLLENIEAELRNRKFAPIVRLEIEAGMSEALVNWLVEELLVNPDRDLYRCQKLLGLDDLASIASLDIPALRFAPTAPITHPRLRPTESFPPEKDFFAVMREGDLLVHHPFQSFQTSVLGMIQAAARDPKVLAIKQTLYRTAPNSPIIAALLKATENGKEVNVQVEIKARFDEAQNIEWVRTLEKAGAHVSYGFIGLKTHCKTLLIVRDEPEGIRRYVHIGTGNYHTITARFYTDFGLFTCDPVLCQDVADLFNYLTGHSNFQAYKKLLVAPVNMRKRFIEMIEREIDHQHTKGNGRIIAKMNQLEDHEVINTLYRASQAGVRIDLIVRGFCCLRPGVPGLSENIRVMSIVHRFLEHSRLYYFANDGAPQYYIGSADWMSRNLSDRVEAITPIESPLLQKELDYILKAVLADRAQAWDLQSDGTYVRRRPRRGRGSQQRFIVRYNRAAPRVHEPKRNG